MKLLPTKRCQICGELPTFEDKDRGEHVCLPIFICRFDWQAGKRGESIGIFANNVLTAAKKFVAQYDEFSNRVTGDAHIIVLDPRDGKTYKSHVTGEEVRTYAVSWMSEIDDSGGNE